MLLEKDFKLPYQLFLLLMILDFTSMFVLVLGLGPKCSVNICTLLVCYVGKVTFS